MNFIAMPSMFNRTNSKQFKTIASAKAYLDETTGYKMRADEWCMVGKIMEVDKNGQLIPAIDIDAILV